MLLLFVLLPTSPHALTHVLSCSLRRFVMLHALPMFIRPVLCVYPPVPVGLHLSLLYLWQLPLPWDRLTTLVDLASRVGLYHVHDPAATTPQLLLRVWHLTSLVVLYMALGCWRDGLFAPLGSVLRSVPSETVCCDQPGLPGLALSVHCSSKLVCCSVRAVVGLLHRLPCVLGDRVVRDWMCRCWLGGSPFPWMSMRMQ